MTYFNTTQETGEQLARYESKASTQEAKILAYFERSSAFLITPSEVRRAVFDNDVPITSVRRAMTNLTNEKKLSKSAEKRKGPHGRPEHCWFKPNRYRQQELFG